MEPALQPTPVARSGCAIPKASRAAHRTHAFRNEAALNLVQRIFLGQTQPHPRMIVFAGIEHGNGCSGIAASVAETLAVNSPKGVCLVEANFRSPALPELFGTTNHHGLSDALSQQTPLQSFVKPIGEGHLWLLSSGALAPGSPQLLTSERLSPRFNELRTEFEYVIVDAPPMTMYADAIALGKISDGVVLVIEAESTRREAAMRATESLHSAKIPVLAAVLNKRSFPIPEKIYSRI